MWSKTILSQNKPLFQRKAVQHSLRAVFCVSAFTSHFDPALLSSVKPLCPVVLPTKMPNTVTLCGGWEYSKAKQGRRSYTLSLQSTIQREWGGSRRIGTFRTDFFFFPEIKWGYFSV